jgi:hypothetical protein
LRLEAPVVVDGNILPVERKDGILPLMQEINSEVPKTDKSQLAQLLMSPARFSLITGVVVWVQGPTTTLAQGTHPRIHMWKSPLEEPLTPSPTISGCFSISSMLLSCSSRCRKLREPLHKRSASPSSLAFAIPFRSSHVVKSAANLGGLWFHAGFIRSSVFDGQFMMSSLMRCAGVAKKCRL